MNAATLAPAPQAAAGRRMLALVAALLALPFAIGGGLFLAGWQPSRTINHGRLVEPPLPLPATGLVAAGGQPLPTATLAGRWLLVLHGSGPCADDCLARIDEMRRIQVSLYKDMARLRRVVIVDARVDGLLAEVARRQPDLVAAAAPPGWLPDAGGPGYRLHVVDPQGALILHYGPDAPARAVRSDLERLLKFAWSG